MTNEFIRSELILGEEALDKLSKARVAVFGIGGVGSYVCEALARCGVGQLDLIDNDVVSMSNINRQLVALHSTIGKDKVEVARERLLDINPNLVIRTYKTFFLPENNEFDFSQYDYVVDAIDTVSGKLAIVENCQKVKTPIICSLGTGNKVNPLDLAITDIYKTSVCPLAKVMRHECKKRGIKKLKVLYSKELPIKPKEGKALEQTILENPNRRGVPGSVSFVPSVAGLVIASEVIKDLVGLAK
ncbi:MAG: tRNA threonylcarbamoyladenosine dehydratase [Erysipelotrichaceae bacterium]|nr:tRNA threonylcarbamoyladenosine dehydratase [Erysipelotrichaceae bacterium]